MILQGDKGETKS